MRITKLIAVSAVVVVAGMYVPARAAFSASPQRVVMKVNKGQRSAWIEVSHTGGGPIAVEITVLNRVLDIDGKQQTKAFTPTPDVTVYPSEIVLYPGDRKRAQIMLRGGGRVTEDRTYAISTKERPLPLPDEDGEARVRTGVTMLMNFLTILAIETDRPGKLSFVSSQRLDIGKVELIVENKSPGRVPVKDMYIMAGKTKITEFTGNSNAIMPGQKRRFTFAHDKPLTAREMRFGYEK